ncbi:MAG: WYL domain-containing protein [Actinomycetota bacterium]|nr:WYL domain-containing protein [Actinomycetota bacterium]MDA3013011.1 WYL domain-containing protein [Actinomycetota bacterium]
MKNVFKRAIELISLFNSDALVSTDFIKDNIKDYRSLSEQSFRRAFERDKSLLKSFGINLIYENDKWSNEKGYSISGNYVYKELLKDDSIELSTFFNTYLYLKKLYFFENNKFFVLENISQLLKSINEKRRIAFDYHGVYKKVKPVGIRLFNNIWYLAAFEDKKLKTFIIKNISNLKIGNKQNLFSQYDKKSKFSWEDKNTDIYLEINLPTYLYEINKHLFHGGKILSTNIQDINLSIKTNDFLGLYKFLMLVSGSYRVLNIKNEKYFKEFLNEI